MRLSATWESVFHSSGTYLVLLNPKSVDINTYWAWYKYAHKWNYTKSSLGFTPVVLMHAFE